LRIGAKRDKGGVNLRRTSPDCGATYTGAHALKDILPIGLGELNSDYRARLAMEQVHADDRRRAELLELTATANAPAARIRAWERTHGLSLPHGEAHRVLNSVAAATRLTLEQVHAEQRRRLNGAAA
jgi:hypothetical protein